MGLQIVMDRNGDTRHEFDAQDPVALAEAERRFEQLLKRGYRAVALDGEGDRGQLIRTFDPKRQKTLFIPQLVSG